MDAGGAGGAWQQDGVGEPDAIQRLWMPHRMAYIKGEGKPAGGDGEECPFCRIPGLPDSDGMIVARGALVYAVLNLYPYNGGHLLVCPMTGMKLVSPPHRGTTCWCRCAAIPAPATPPRFIPMLKPCAPDAARSAVTARLVKAASSAVSPSSRLT